jgi:hydrogenase maturation protease
MSGRRVVIGVGNPFRRDDGVGWAVARALEPKVGAVEVSLLDGEPARLLDAWADADLAIVVDAVRTGAAPGAVGVVDPGAARTGGGESHGLGIADAVALGERLGRLPARLTVVGVEGADYREGPGLSPAVEAAVAPAVALVTSLLEGSVPCA